MTTEPRILINGKPVAPTVSASISIAPEIIDTTAISRVLLSGACSPSVHLHVDGARVCVCGKEQR